MFTKVITYSIVELIVVSFFQASYAFQKPECLKEVKIFTSLDSIFIDNRQVGVHTRSNNLDNPFSNISGISVGGSYHISNTNFYISLKTNRLLNFSITKQASVYNNDTFIKNASSSFQSQNDVLSLGYQLAQAPNIFPFIFASNSNVTTKLTDNTSSKIKNIDTFYYGCGVNIFLTRKISTSVAFIMPNNDVNTDYAFSLSANYLLLD